MTRATMIQLLLCVLLAQGCDRKKRERDSVSSTSDATITTSVASDLGPAPAGVSKEAREQAVLELLAGGSPAAGLPIAALDEGKLFDPRLRDRLAPRVEAGTPRVQDGPICDASVGGAGVAGGPVANAAAVVARMKGRFRACCQAGMNSNPEMAGSVVLVAKIGPNGEVLAVSGGGGSIAPILGCLKSVVQGGSFAPPDGGSAVLSIPITFVKR